MDNIQDKGTMVITYLEKKYDEQFDIVSFTAANIDMPYDYVVCKNSRGERFAVYIEQEDDQQIIRDGYYGILKAEEYRDIIKKILSAYLPEYKYFYNFTASYFDNQYDSDYLLQDALADNKTQFFSRNYIFVSERTREKLSEAVFEEMVAALRKHGLTMYIALYSVPEDRFCVIDETQDVNLYLPTDYKAEPMFKRTIK